MPPTPDYLVQATMMLAKAHLELTEKGHHPRIVDSALDRASGMADFHTRDVSSSIRPQAYLDVLRAELTRCEAWAILQAKGGK